MNTININPLEPSTAQGQFDFALPDELQCAKPTEERGIRRDEVRLLVSRVSTDTTEHAIFKDIGQFLSPGDVLAVNTSGTLKAALEAFRTDGQTVRVHLSTKVDAARWVVEVREVVGERTRRFDGTFAGELLALKHGGSLEILEPYYQNQHQTHLNLWIARVQIPIPVEEYLDYYGAPIRYQNVKAPYPYSYYQTAFAREVGSAEMPSAGRPFTPELITRLVSGGILFAPILLHTGVASLELDERPYQEYYRVPQATADVVNLAREKGRRVIAVGTTAVRALESAVGSNGAVEANEGWTDLYVTPQRGLFAANALLTGFHEPRASHLLMLEALAGRAHLETTYREALERQYQWHEFGDLHLILR